MERLEILESQLKTLDKAVDIVWTNTEYEEDYYMDMQNFIGCWTEMEAILEKIIKKEKNQCHNSK